MKDVILEALEYACDLTWAMPEEGLALEGDPIPGRVVKPNLDLVWRALAKRERETSRGIVS